LTISLGLITESKESAFVPCQFVRHGERAASAVEFALVAPLLFGLLFGIVDYGLYFADVVTVQQGLGNAARTATLAPSSASGPLWGGSTCQLQHDSGVTGGDQLEHLACSVLTGVEPLAGQLYVRAELVDGSGQRTQTWAVGNRLRLCSITDHPPVLPVVPLPAGGRIETRVDMPVQAVPAVVQMASVQTPLPSGDWSWC
jgi:TadE-like protein